MDINKEKIKCSIGILTLNSEKGLPACLASVKEFAEIIICDGNSTDRTREIAEAAGARVIRQYETDALNIPCVKDKADLCQKNMEASNYDWHFRMDSDDTLSQEVVDEVRHIVSDPRPPHLIYRMPTRIFFEEGDRLKEIKHEATYPSYHIRLSHKSVGLHFKGDVHNRPSFDEKKFPVGTMKSYYDFHWSETRVKDIWSFFRKYADWEIEITPRVKLENFLYWGVYRRLRTILGYILWRLPVMYLRYGFRDSMPLSIELKIVRYQCRIFFGTVGVFFGTRRWLIYLREIMRGKDINRILSNIALMDKECMGEILDIGGGDARASHYRFMRVYKWHSVTTVDIDPKAKPDHVVDVEKEKLPFPDETFDYVLFMNVLEHLNNGRGVLSEIYRVLKIRRSDGGPHLRGQDWSGNLIGVIPFLVNIHPNPHDFVRLTEEGLTSLLVSAGFPKTKIKIKPIGSGPFTAGYYQFEFMIPRIFRLIFGPIAFLLDWLAIKISRQDLTARFPLSYVFTASKI